MIWNTNKNKDDIGHESTVKQLGGGINTYFAFPIPGCNKFSIKYQATEYRRDYSR